MLTPLCYFGATAPAPINLAFLNMAACNIYTDLTVAVPVRTYVAGIGTVSIPIPRSGILLGNVVYNQWGVADQRVSPLMGFALSDGVKVTLGNQLGGNAVSMSVISGQGGQANQRSGFLQPNRGAVFQVVYQ